MKGYKIWVGKSPDESMFKLATTWDNAVVILKGLEQVFETGKFKNSGITEVCVDHCKSCGRLELELWLNNNPNRDCIHCEDMRAELAQEKEDFEYLGEE